ncbi:MAG: hypothetical protein RJA83_643 [Pseudomonadota bacterium]|jgi:hypothetical protein
MPPKSVQKITGISEKKVMALFIMPNIGICAGETD